MTTKRTQSMGAPCGVSHGIGAQSHNTHRAAVGVVWKSAFGREHAPLQQGGGGSSGGVSSVGWLGTLDPYIWLTVARADFGRPQTPDIIYVNRRLRLLPEPDAFGLQVVCNRGSSRILSYGTGAGIPDLSLRRTIHTA